MAQASCWKKNDKCDVYPLYATRSGFVSSGWRPGVINQCSDNQQNGNHRTVALVRYLITKKERKMIQCGEIMEPNHVEGKVYNVEKGTNVVVKSWIPFDRICPFQSKKEEYWAPLLKEMKRDEEVQRMQLNIDKAKSELAVWKERYDELVMRIQIANKEAQDVLAKYSM